MRRKQTSKSLLLLTLDFTPMRSVTSSKVHFCVCIFNEEFMIQRNLVKECKIIS